MSQAAPSPQSLQQIPVTFASYLHQQLHNWDELFPAEQSYLNRLFAHLKTMPEEAFEPLRAIEQQMGVTPSKWPRDRFTLDQVDYLNRNAHYPKWRAEIARLFSQIDPVLEQQVVAKGRTRLMVILGPPEMPVGPDRLWTRLRGRGRRVRVAVPDDLDHYIPLLLAGSADPGKGQSLSAIGTERAPYASWIVEATGALGVYAAASRAVHLSYAHLLPYRERLMREVRKITEDSSIAGPRQLSDRLKQLRIKPSESTTGSDARLAEFIRATLLAGNGTLLINNTFVEWASVQAIRRARPDVLITSFGIRNKVKPFSSLLIFHEQDKVTPIPDQADVLGSYVDLEVFYQYVSQEPPKHAEYRHNTAYLFAVPGVEEIHLIAPPDFPLPESGDPLPLTAIYGAARTWLVS